jgi:putative ABC transport system permease protein
MLGIAVALGVPAAFFINNLWLEMIAYHVSMDWSVIVTGVLVLIFFGVLTVGSQTVRATFVKPAENLKSE